MTTWNAALANRLFDIIDTSIDPSKLTKQQTAALTQFLNAYHLQKMDALIDAYNALGLEAAKTTESGQVMLL
jgi:hypothetical protein